MPKIAYIDKKFSAASAETIERANSIIAEYAGQGFDLTLRQLYYQFVARALIPNRDSEYKRLGGIISDARLAGLIDWNSISDRTRALRSLGHWGGPEDIIQSAAASHHLDHWKGQAYRPEVWIEKDALVGVIEGICDDWDIPYFSCRGYTSQSEMWRASQRLIGQEQRGQVPIILHLGDHDPSGIDMTRDITDRLETFTLPLEVRRLALNSDQVDEYNPPPNPAKVTDSRYIGYVRLHGEDSWELDALEPQVIADLIDKAVRSLVDQAEFDTVAEQEKADKALLRDAADRWADVTALLNGERSDEDAETDV